MFVFGLLRKLAAVEEKQRSSWTVRPSLVGRSLYVIARQVVLDEFARSNTLAQFTHRSPTGGGVAVQPSRFCIEVLVRLRMLPRIN